MRFLLLPVILFCMAGHIYSQTSSTRYVAVQTAVLKSSTGFFASRVGELSLGDEVTAIRESGKWTQVSKGNLSGWVATTSLSTRRIVSSGSSATIGEYALAGKGFSKELEIEYRKSGLDYSIVDSMERLVIEAAELERFVTEGRLARGE